MADENDSSGGARVNAAKFKTPPYIAYKTLLTLIGDLNTHGLPPLIDRSIMTRFAGGVQGQLLVAMRVLGLIGETNKPTATLAQLVDSYGTPHFKPIMRGVIEVTYPYVFALDLTNATPGMFAKAFSEALDAKEDVLRKCRTFFLNAARDVGIEIGARIEKAKFPRVRTNGAPRKPKTATKAAETPASPATAENATAADDGGVLGQLLAKFPDFDPAWTDDLKAKWFAGFGQFMEKAQKSGG